MTTRTTPQAWNPIAAAVCGSIACGLLVGGGSSCSFLLVTAKSNETLAVTASSDQNLDTLSPQGVFCDAGFYDLEADPMWQLSRTFLSFALIMVALATILSWCLSFCLASSVRLWRAIFGLSAVSSLLQVPVFIIFQTEPCSKYESNQSCIMSSGSYVTVTALLATITVTLITQFLDPPTARLGSAKIERKEQDTDSSLDSGAPSDSSFLSSLRACHGQCRSPPKDDSNVTSSDQDVADIEEGLCRGCFGEIPNNAVADDSNKWETFPSLFDVAISEHSASVPPAEAKRKPIPSTPTTNISPTDIEDLEQSPKRTSIFREIPVTDAPNASVQSSSPSRDPPGKLANEERFFRERALFSMEGGRAVTSMRGKFLRGYALFDEHNLESCFPATPPLEIVTVQQMDPKGFENDDDSIDLGFGTALGEDDDDLKDYWKSINELPMVTPPAQTPTCAQKDLLSEFDDFYRNRDPELQEHPADSPDDQDDDDDDVEDEAAREKARQEIIVAEVLRRRGGGGRQKKRRRKKTSVSSVSSSPSSLLDITIEEETPEDLVAESEDDKVHGTIDPYTDCLLMRTYSAPNLMSYNPTIAQNNCKAYDCEHMNGVNSHHLVETWWSDEHDARTAEESRQVRFGPTVEHGNPRSEERTRQVGFIDDTKTYSSDPTERTRRARMARIRRLQLQNQTLTQTRICEESSNIAPEPRVAIIEDIVALQLIQSNRPKDSEYGPDEMSL